MLTTSADYKTAIAATDREMRGYLKFNNDSTKIMRGCDGLISMKHTAQIADQERPTFACACASVCEVDFYNSGIPAGVSLANSYFDAYIGVVTKDTGTAPIGSIEPDTKTVEYVFMGRFFIDTVDRGKLSTKVTAYDEYGKLNKPYVCNVAETPSGYPINQIIGDIRVQCGLINQTTPSANMGYVPKIYECTCRQMLGWVVSVYGSGANCKASRSSLGQVAYISIWGAYSHKDNAGHTITDNTIYLGGLSDNPAFTFNSVVTGTEDNPVSVGSGTGIVGENPYYDTAMANTLLTNISGITYTPTEIEFRGDPSIEQGDVMKVVSGGSTYYTYVQKVVTTFNGGCKQTLYCYGDSEWHYDMSTSPTQAAIKTAVSNMAQEIQQEIETADNGVITKVLDLDGSWKELVIANNQDLSAATSVWRWNINGLAHSTAYSGGTYNFAVDMQGRIIANAIQTGLLTDAQGKNSWNLDTGALTITDGSINITTNNQYADKIVLSYTSGNSTYKSSTTPTYIELLYTNSATPSSNRSFQYSSRGLDSDVLEPNGPGNGFTTRFYLRNDSIRMVDATTFGITLLDSSIGLRITDDWNDSNKVELKPNSLIFLDSTATPEITIKKYSSQSVNTAPSTTIDLYGFNVYRGNGSVAVVRAGLTENGLTFKDSSNTVTATYPATGLQKLTGATDSTSATGCVFAVPSQTFSSATTQQAAAEALLKYICTNYPNKTSCTFIGNYITTASRRGYELYISSTSTVNANGLPQYASGIVYEISSTMQVYSINCVNYVVTLAYSLPRIGTAETSDLNNCTESGIYEYTSAATNNPTGTGGMMLSTKYSSTYGTQLLFGNSAIDDGARLYYRRKNINGWQALRGIMTLKTQSGSEPINESVIDYVANSGTTRTYTLRTAHTYLVTVARRNTTTTDKDGLWICAVHSTNSHLTAVKSPGVTYTISVSSTTLSITTWDNYMNISILDLGGY